MLAAATERKPHYVSDNFTYCAIKMKNLNDLIFASLLIFTLNCLSQNVGDSTLDSLYLKSLNQSVNLYLSSGYKYFEPNERMEQIKNNFSQTVLKFPNDKELFRIARKSKNEINVFRCWHKIISKDTIDVNIDLISYEAKRGIYFRNGLHFKKIKISIPCGGTEGYIPDFRYVFNKEKNIWESVGNKNYR